MWLVEKALEGNGEGEGVVSKEIRNYRERQARLAKERREREQEAERKRREHEEEEAKREKRRKEREEREYKDRELDWLDHERLRQREKRRIEEDLAERKYRRKQLLLDDDEDDKTRRREIKSSSRRRDRLREREEDRHFKLKEIHEQELKRREQLRIEEERRIREKEARERIQLQPVSQPEMRTPPRITDVRRAGEREGPSAVGQFKEEIVSVSQDKQTPSGLKVALSLSTPSNKRSSSTAGLFKVETEEEIKEATVIVKKRKLVTLEDNTLPGDAEEQEAKIEPNGGSVVKEEKIVDPVAEAKAKALAIVDRIPKEKEELFAFVIDCSLIEKHNVVEEKMRPWVKKKIMEFLGEEEETLIDYICKKLTEHVSPEELLSLLAYVLEDEAIDFVIRLWRMLIYNLLMLQM